MNVFLLDVDNTLADFQPTGRLYRRLFLSQPRIRYYLIGYFMMILLKLFWFIPLVVTFQRMLILTLFSSADKQVLDTCSTEIAQAVATSYHTKFKNILDEHRKEGDTVYLLTHCPDIVAEKIVDLLSFNGHYSLAVGNYFLPLKIPANMNKVAVLKRIRDENSNAFIHYYADDLIDIKCLLTADRGTLINPTLFTKKVVQLLFRRIHITK